jgi:hypothetical protein
MKIGMFSVFLALILLPWSILIHGVQEKSEPQSSLLHRINTRGYSFASIGDSIFCSYYVNNDNDTIWNKFYLITGKKCFPGSLDGATIGDIVDAAKYISYRLC